MSSLHVQRRFMILWMSYVAVLSYTISRNHRKSTNPLRTTASLMFSHYETSSTDELLSESEMIRVLMATRSSIEVDRFLKRANHTMNAEQSPHTTIHLDQESINSTLQNLPHFSLNITAAALRRLAQVSVMEARGDDSDPTTTQLRNNLLSNLLGIIGSQIVLAQRTPEGHLGVYPLSDILQALAILSYNRLESMQPLAILVLEMLGRHETEDLHKLGPIRLIQCLQAMKKLDYLEHPVTYTIFQRLLKPDAFSKLPARFLCHGLSTLSSMEPPFSDDAQRLTKSFMRRLRKEKVWQDASVEDLHRALMVALKVHGTDFQDEVTIFGFTILRAIIRKKNRPFSPWEFADFVSVWANLTNHGQQSDAVIETLVENCREDGILQNCTWEELERVSGSIQRLEVPYREELIQSVGVRLAQLVRSNLSCKPSTVHGILQASVLLRNNQEVLSSFQVACTELVSDDEFLEKCTTEDIVQFLWISSMTHWYDQKVLTILGEKVLDPSLVESCTPHSACRIIGTYTAILSRQQKHRLEEMMPLTAEIFHSYGIHLLSSQLTPAEVSSSLYAYAKVSYVHDMGIYDHLVKLMRNLTEQSSARQLAQSIWSCGKMIRFESFSSANGAEQVPPPYLENAEKIARALAKRAEELSIVDTTQCIWAFGRLHFTDEAIVQPFLERAIGQVDSTNAVEASNILWGMSKIGQRNLTLIHLLTTRLTREEVATSPREAASALYALGRLQVQDEEAFRNLARIMIADIDNANAQSIANTLWAYREVSLAPPQELLASWLTQKIGLVSIESHLSSD